MAKCTMIRFDFIIVSRVLASNQNHREIRFDISPLMIYARAARQLAVGGPAHALARHRWLILSISVTIDDGSALAAMACPSLACALARRNTSLVAAGASFFTGMHRRVVSSACC